VAFDSVDRGLLVKTLRKTRGDKGGTDKKSGRRNVVENKK